jgi:prepilin-type N-terminal cleavage/methylation domain-containing protein
MNAPATGTRSTAGFTLVEILVGLVLLSAFLTGIYTVVIGTMVAKRTIEESAAVYTAGPEILDLIERDLRAAYTYDVKDGKAFKAQQVSVGGKNVTTLDMITTTNSKVAVEIDNELERSDITEVGYRLKTSDTFPDLLELYRREQLFYDDDLEKGGQYYLVYDRLVSLEIRFFDDPNADNTGENAAPTSSVASTEGYEAWDSADKKGLPQAAKIKLVLGTPPELKRPGDNEERDYVFVRWVLFPTAFDKAPAPANDNNNNNNNR